MKSILNIIKILNYYISYLLKVFIKSPSLAIQEAWQYFFLYRIAGVSKDLQVLIGGVNMIIPNSHHAFYTLHEVFTWKLYKKLEGCNRILDLGGFLGDTGVCFGLYAKYVDIFEPNPINFGYILKNIQNNSNIQAHNYAVIASEKETFYMGGALNAGGKIDPSGTEKVASIHIKDIIKNGYDGLKMDIEGGEYEILGYLIANDKFLFKKGYIEFHYYTKIENKKILDLFIKHLQVESYHFELEDVYGKVISYNDIYKLDPNIFVLYFEKK